MKGKRKIRWEDGALSGWAERLSRWRQDRKFDPYGFKPLIFSGFWILSNRYVPWQMFCIAITILSFTYNYTKMKNTVKNLTYSIILLGLFLPQLAMAQDASQVRITSDSKAAKADFLKADPSMKNLFKNASGYVIFPNVGKGGLGVGGAAGKGAVYEKGKTIGSAQMVQVTVGAQAGGQAYREIIFFESKDALDRFKQNKIEFSGQASATAVKSGASANANYRDGVVVFSQTKGGLMLEASLGGQKFTFKELK